MNFSIPSLPQKGFSAVLKEFTEEVDLVALVEGISPVLAASDLATTGVASAGLGIVKIFQGSYQAFKERTHPVQTLARASKLMKRLTGDQLVPAETLVSEVNSIAHALETVSARRVLILFEGLDKTLDLDDVLLAFDDVELLRRLDPAVVIAGPTNLRHDVRFAGLAQDLEVSLVHNLPVVSRDGKDHEPGIDTLEEILSRRLGPALRGLIPAEAIRCAARASSGIPRSFFRILNEAALIAESRNAPQVELADVDVAIKDIRLTLQQPLTRSDVALLGSVLCTSKVGDEPRDQKLLYENLIACYPNQDAWFRPNEILVDWIAREQELLRQLD